MLGPKNIRIRIENSEIRARKAAIRQSFLVNQYPQGPQRKGIGK